MMHEMYSFGLARQVANDKGFFVQVVENVFPTGAGEETGVLDCHWG
jgi:hypothetical protein